MLEWIVYVEGLPRHRYLATGTAYSGEEAKDQARQHLIWRLEEGVVTPRDRIEIVIENNVAYVGAIEAYLGQGALRKMGLD